MLNDCIQVTCVLFYTSLHYLCEAVWTFDTHFGVSPYALTFIGYKSIINYSVDTGIASLNCIHKRKHLEITFMTKYAYVNDCWRVWNIVLRNSLPIGKKKESPGLTKDTGYFTWTSGGVLYTHELHSQDLKQISKCVYKTYFITAYLPVVKIMIKKPFQNCLSFQRESLLSVEDQKVRNYVIFFYEFPSHRTFKHPILFHSLSCSSYFLKSALLPFLFSCFQSKKFVKTLYSVPCPPSRPVKYRKCHFRWLAILHKEFFSSSLAILWWNGAAYTSLSRLL